MKPARGLVSSVGEDGRASVVIYTTDDSVKPGCPEADVCACSGGRSQITIKALNQAGAKTGDVVSISRNPGTAMKSLLILLGIPLSGLILGTSVGGMMLQSRTIDATGLAVASLGGLLLGALAAVVVYRRISGDDRFAPIIDSILRSVAKATAIDPVCKMRVDPATAAANLTYQDTTYYFCHPGCRESFVKDPAAYLRGS